ncbi:hypothetical protein MBLNU13_g00895t1 [Cladosporium sp. NU13]
MHLPTHVTSPQAATTISDYLTTLDPSPTLIERERPDPLSIFIPPTTEPSNFQTSRRIVWQTPNVVMDNIPTTLVTVTTTAHATRWVTLPVKSATAAATGLLASATATQHAADTPAAELAEVGKDIPHWPPLLIIFLLCWVTVAWAIALVLYLATFPEKVAWLDRLLARLRGSVGGHGDRRKKSAGKSEESGGTAAIATGLGISFDESPQTPRLRRPCSFDSKFYEIRGLKPVYGDLAATAPLPSNVSFKMLSPGASPTKSDTEREHHQEDLQSGKHEVRECDRRLEGQQQPDTGGIAGVLESVNALIDFVARNMARMASDRVVDSAERGLLLPVKEEEREPAVCAV